MKYTDEKLERLFKMQLQLNDAFMALIRANQDEVKHVHKMQEALADDLFGKDDDVAGLLSATDSGKPKKRFDF